MNKKIIGHILYIIRADRTKVTT